jgi:hypothetical protein
VELTEPLLYLVHSAGAVDRFAEAIAARVGERRGGRAERIGSGGTA